MMPKTCEVHESRDAVERYVAGTLAGAEAEEFERHLVGCHACQDAVRLGSAVRAELSAATDARVAGSRPPWRNVLAALALAAAVVAVAGTRVVRDAALRQLGEIGEAPRYGGVAVRSSLGGADSLFADGMGQYGEGRYDAARTALTAARAAGADSVPTSFFLGIVALMRSDAEAATRELGIVVSAGSSPYAAEAHYYLAKGWLRRGNTDSARAHLVAASNASAEGAPIAALARALADSVAGVTR